jgi:hypothetical protein
MNATGRGGFGDHPEHINRGEERTLTSVLRERAGPETAQEIADKLIALAKAGNMAAMKYVYDRLDGMPRQSVQVSGGENPIGLIFVNPGEIAEDTSTSEAG